MDLDTMRQAENPYVAPGWPGTRARLVQVRRQDARAVRPEEPGPEEFLALADTGTEPKSARAGQTPLGPYAKVFKRLLDLTLVLLMAPIVLMLVMVLVALVKLDGGPAFYFQSRVGRGGRVFRMWKLRSMVPDAEQVLAALLDSDPAARAEWEHTQKLRHDPRVTPVGRWIRKLSLDELPQIWNVVTGDMSLVGPRPFMPEQRDLYPGEEYYKMRPGLTGFWQVEERNSTSFAARAVFDREYYERLSLMTDLRILTATVAVVMRGTGI